METIHLNIARNRGDYSHSCILLYGGTVYLHQGQEIGMINLTEEWPLEEWKDCKTQNVAKKYVPMSARLD